MRILGRATPTSRATTACLLSVLLLVTSGCVTTLGYVSENMKPRRIENKVTLIPTYTEVKTWAYDVQDGYDSRATMNRHAVSFGALFGLAAAGATVGLAAFGAGASALKAIPIGGSFLAGVGTVYNNNWKAELYQRASTQIKALINISDARVTSESKPGTTTSADSHTEAALCLKRQVDIVVAKVGCHLTMSEPQQVVAALASLASGADTGNAPAGVPLDSPKPSLLCAPPVPPTVKSATSGSRSDAGASAPADAPKDDAKPDKALDALKRMVGILAVAKGDLSDLDIPGGSMTTFAEQVTNQCAEFEAKVKPEERK